MSAITSSARRAKPPIAQSRPPQQDDNITFNPSSSPLKRQLHLDMFETNDNKSPDWHITILALAQTLLSIQSPSNTGDAGDARQSSHTITLQCVDGIDTIHKYEYLRNGTTYKLPRNLCGITLSSTITLKITYKIQIQQIDISWLNDERSYNIDKFLVYVGNFYYAAAHKYHCITTQKQTTALSGETSDARFQFLKHWSIFTPEQLNTIIMHILKVEPLLPVADYLTMLETVYHVLSNDSKITHCSQILAKLLNASASGDTIIPVEDYVRSLKLCAQALQLENGSTLRTTYDLAVKCVIQHGAVSNFNTLINSKSNVLATLTDEQIDLMLSRVTINGNAIPIQDYIQLISHICDKHACAIVTKITSKRATNQQLDTTDLLVLTYAYGSIFCASQKSSIEPQDPQPQYKTLQQLYVVVTNLLSSSSTLSATQNLQFPQIYEKVCDCLRSIFAVYKPSLNTQHDRKIIDYLLQLLTLIVSNTCRIPNLHGPSVTELLTQANATITSLTKLQISIDSIDSITTFIALFKAMLTLHENASLQKQKCSNESVVCGLMERIVDCMDKIFIKTLNQLYSSDDNNPLLLQAVENDLQQVISIPNCQHKSKIINEIQSMLKTVQQKYAAPAENKIIEQVVHTDQKET